MKQTIAIGMVLIYFISLFPLSLGETNADAGISVKSQSDSSEGSSRDSSRDRKQCVAKCSYSTRAGCLEECLASKAKVNVKASSEIAVNSKISSTAADRKQGNGSVVIQAYGLPEHTACIKRVGVICGKELPGALVEIYGKAGDFLGRQITDDNGEAGFSGMPLGSLLTAKVTKDGYEGKKHPFILQGKEKKVPVQLAAKPSTNPGLSNESSNEGRNDSSETMPQEPSEGYASAVFRAYRADPRRKCILRGPPCEDPIVGALIEVYQASNAGNMKLGNMELIAKSETGIDGTVLIEKLPAGVYLTATASVRAAASSKPEMQKERFILKADVNKVLTFSFGAKLAKEGSEGREADEETERRNSGEDGKKKKAIDSGQKKRIIADFKESKEKLKVEKEAFLQSRGKKDTKDEFERAKAYVAQTARVMAKQLENIKAEILGSERILQDDGEAIAARIDSQMNEIAALQKEIDSAGTKAELKAVSSKLRISWDKIKHFAKVYLQRVLAAKVEGLFNSMQAIEKRLGNVIGDAKEEGIVIEVDADIISFKKHLSLARDALSDALAKNKEAGDLKEDGAKDEKEKAKALYDEARRLLKESQMHIKEAHSALKIIVKKIKEKKPEADFSVSGEIIVQSTADASAPLGQETASFEAEAEAGASASA